MVDHRFAGYRIQQSSQNVPLFAKSTAVRAQRPGARGRTASTLLLTLLFAAPNFAFHELGVARCNGCHVTHGSLPEAPIVLGLGGEPLLLAATPSDVCLLCHKDGVFPVFGADPLNPPTELGGGNFVFLLEENLNDGPDGAFDPIPGDAAGHNLNAPSQGLFPDGRRALAPGGTFPSLDLGCTSCHDPHGRDTFRMLYGIGEVQDGIITFSAEAPEADGISSLMGGEGRSRHNAYRSGVSEWCGNCHGRYHDIEPTSFEHPIDQQLDIEQVDQYNRYDGDDNPTGGNQFTSYLPEIPFEEGTNTSDSTAGPSFSARLMCLSCHRAHASSAPSAGRWDFNIAVLEEDGVRSGSHKIRDPYQSPNQGTLCRKCHETVPSETGQQSIQFVFDN